VIKSTTSKERLIELATAVFARDGFEASSLRAIAREAAVSPALLVHHFGSRQELVEECISATLGQWMGTKKDLMAKPLSQSVAEWQNTVEEHGVELEFFRQVLIHGGPNATILFGQMVIEATQMVMEDIASGKMRDFQQPEDAALIMVLHGLAPLILKPQVDQVLGGNFLDPLIGMRLAKTNLEIYNHGVYTNQTKDGEK
jgi:AcrR family transcriptional regulator